jgi:hypothetical protein
MGFKFPTMSPVALADLMPHASTDALQLIADMLLYDPHRRPTAQEALQHPWFNDMWGSPWARNAISAEGSSATNGQPHHTNSSSSLEQKTNLEEIQARERSAAAARAMAALDTVNKPNDNSKSKATRPLTTDSFDLFGSDDDEAGPSKNINSKKGVLNDSGTDMTVAKLENMAMDWESPPRASNYHASSNTNHQVAANETLRQSTMKPSYDHPEHRDYGSVVEDTRYSIAREASSKALHVDTHYQPSNDTSPGFVKAYRPLPGIGGVGGGVGGSHHQNDDELNNIDDLFREIEEATDNQQSTSKPVMPPNPLKPSPSFQAPPLQPHQKPFFDMGMVQSPSTMSPYSQKQMQPGNQHYADVFKSPSSTQHQHAGSSRNRAGLPHLSTKSYDAPQNSTSNQLASPTQTTSPMGIFQGMFSKSPKKEKRNTVDLSIKGKEPTIYMIYIIVHLHSIFVIGNNMNSRTNLANIGSVGGPSSVSPSYNQSQNHNQLSASRRNPYDPMQSPTSPSGFGGNSNMRSHQKNLGSNSSIHDRSHGGGIGGGSGHGGGGGFGSALGFSGFPKLIPANIAIPGGRLRSKTTAPGHDPLFMGVNNGGQGPSGNSYRHNGHGALSSGGGNGGGGVGGGTRGIPPLYNTSRNGSKSALFPSMDSRAPGIGSLTGSRKPAMMGMGMGGRG